MRSKKQKSAVLRQTAGIILADKIVSLPIGLLKINPRNSRVHSDKQISQIAKSMAHFGVTNPVLITEEREMIAGHGRYAAAKLLGHSTIRTLTISGLSQAEKRALALADNRLPEGATWDLGMLRVELAEMVVLDGFDIELTGFSTAEIDNSLDDGVISHQDEIVPPPSEPDKVVSRRGDLWMLGQHRLFCGDATDAASYVTLLGGRKADLVFIDPPFNLKVGYVSGLGRIRHREFAMASGEMSSTQFIQFLATVLGLLGSNSRRGSIHFVCIDWRHIGELLTAGREVYSEFKNLCVWAKTNAGMGSLYRSQHELVAVFQNGPGKFTNNVNLGVDGRYRSNLWTYAGQNTMHKHRLGELAMHPTVKPLSLVADAIRDCSKRNDLVLDVFSGSGTTILAAHRTGRVGATMEIDPAYVDVSILRWTRATGASAILAATGQTFVEVRQARLGSDKPVSTKK